MDAFLIGVTLLDRDGEYFQDGSEQFTFTMNMQRGPVWEVMFQAMRDRKPVSLDLTPAEPVTLPRLRKK